jgi:hypothetical protein
MEMKRQSDLTVEAILSIDVELELVVFISYVPESKRPQPLHKRLLKMNQPCIQHNVSKKEIWVYS